MLVAAFFIIGASLAYTYQSTLIPLLLNPLGGEKLVYLNPAGGFSFIFMISIYAGIALAFPVLLQQLYGFLRPVLPKEAQKKSLIIIISSLLLLLAGILFGYFVAVPNALTFLYAFAESYVEASLTAESYLNFIIAYTIGIGIVFQLPLLLLLIHTIKPFTPGGLLKSEKWVILIAFIIAAIITPTPDPINQAIIAGPVVVVYQIGVVAILTSIYRKRRAIKAANRKQLAAAKAEAKALRQTPIISATPLALEQDPLPDHSPILGTALLSLDGVRVTPKPSQSPEPVAVEVPATPQAPQLPKDTAQKTVDGFIVRRQAPRLQIPQRQQPQPIKPPVRPELPRKNAPQSGFYVDGIISPRQATSF